MGGGGIDDDTGLVARAARTLKACSFVLVVEDEDDVRQQLVEAVSDAGAVAVDAASGEEAVEICRRGTPAFIVTDLMLGESGFSMGQSRSPSRLDGGQMLKKIEQFIVGFQADEDALIVTCRDNASRPTGLARIEMLSKGLEHGLSSDSRRRIIDVVSEKVESKSHRLAREIMQPLSHVIDMPANQDSDAHTSESHQVSAFDESNINDLYSSYPNPKVIKTVDTESEVERAEVYFRELMKDDSWYQANIGKNVAIVGREVVLHTTIDGLLGDVERRFPDRQVFVDVVSRDPIAAIFRSPREPYARRE